MSKFAVAFEDVSAVFLQLDQPTRAVTSYLIDSVTCPDENDAAVQAAIANLPAARKTTLKSHAAHARYDKEVAGLSTDVGGATVTLASTIASQSKVSASAQQAQINPNFTAQWKQTDGTFLLLNATQLLKLNENIQNYIETCYNTEKSCCDQIDAGTMTTTAQIDAAFNF